jgi:hypothetical protein
VPSRTVEFPTVQAVRDFTVYSTADRRTLDVQFHTAAPLQTRRVDLLRVRSECPLALWNSKSFLAASYARSPAVSPDNSIARLITSSAEGVSRSSLLLLFGSRWPPWRLPLRPSFDLLLSGDGLASALGSDVFWTACGEGACLFCMITGISLPVRYVSLPYSVRRITVHVNLRLRQACGLSVKPFSTLCRLPTDSCDRLAQRSAPNQSGCKQQSPTSSKKCGMCKKRLVIP